VPDREARGCVMSTMPVHRVHQHSHLARVAWRALAVLGGGYLMLGVGFFAYATYDSLFRRILGNEQSADRLIRDLVHPAGYLLLVAALTWWVLHRWPHSLLTAIWLTLPTAAVLVAIGTSVPSGAVGFAIGAVLAVCALALMLWRRRPWEQLFAASWTAVFLAIVILAGVEM